jgi:RNA polymerase sigma-70 factor, ECF subfamily
MLSEKRLLEIYGLYKKELFLYIFRMTFSREASEDILHDCFEKLIKYSKDYDLEDANLRSFLYKTAHNLTVNHLQKENRYAMVEFDDSLASGRQDDSVSLLELDELNREIYAILELSDPVTRSIFIMRKEQGMEIGKIAEFLHISKRTVRRRIHGLLETMQDALKKKGLLIIFFIIMARFIISSVVYTG